MLWSRLGQERHTQASTGTERRNSIWKDGVVKDQIDESFVEGREWLTSRFLGTGFSHALCVWVLLSCRGMSIYSFCLTLLFYKYIYGVLPSQSISSCRCLTWGVRSSQRVSSEGENKGFPSFPWLLGLENLCAGDLFLCILSLFRLTLSLSYRLLQGPHNVWLFITPGGFCKAKGSAQDSRLRPLALSVLIPLCRSAPS